MHYFPYVNIRYICIILGTLCRAAGAAPPALAASAVVALAGALPRDMPLRGLALRPLAALGTRAVSALQNESTMHTYDICLL